MTNIQVAIDGPAGSGKSSISDIVAKRLNFLHIDTGAIYRAITFYALENNIDINEEANFNFINNLKIEYKSDKVFLNDKDVTNEIRTDLVTKNVSQVSKFKIVRDKVNELIRKISQTGKILMDGRDIGTVVLPNATVKIFLTATPLKRAERRYNEIKDKFKDLTLEDVLNDIKLRDEKDSNRKIAPLKQAEDAILVDTSELTIEEVCQKIIEIINNKVGNIMSDETKEITSMADVKLEKRPRPGQIVTGVVVDVKDDEVCLDLHAFTEGRIHLNHYTLDPKVTSFKGLVNLGDEMTVQITKVEENDYSGAIYCSRLNLLKDEKFKEILTYVDNKTRFTCHVLKKEEKGYRVSYQGFNFFLPLSQARNVNVGDDIVCELLSVDEKRQTGVVSNRVVVEEELKANREQELNSINIGDVLEGEVVKVLPFAAFVKFNYVQGVLRISDISHEFISKIDEHVHVGDKLKVKVVTKEDGKLGLSLKALLPTPFEVYVNEHKVGETVKAKVVNKLPYGLLLELASHVRGLLHRSDYSWNPNDNFNNCVNIGDEVEVAISDINVAKERISLSRKALIDNPWQRVKAKVGDVCECKILEFNEKGVKVETLGVDGFIPNPAFLLEGQNGKPSDYYAIGDKIEAIITEIRPREWVLRLSVRKLKQIQEKNNYTKYMQEESDSTKVTLGDVFKDVLK